MECTLPASGVAAPLATLSADRAAANEGVLIAVPLAAKGAWTQLRTSRA